MFKTPFQHGMMIAAVAAISFSVAACDRDSAEQAAVTAAELRLGAAALSGGHARVLVDGINAAENLLFTNDGRLLVSGDDGVFEIIQDGPSYHSVARHGGESCKFGGLVEAQSTIYANCYGGTDSWLFAAPLTAALEFRVIQRLPGYALANGLTSDDDGNLYIAATFQGQILRLRPSVTDPLTIASQDVFIASPGLFSDGIKFFDGSLYWTNFTDIDAATITNDRAGWTQSLATALTFFDDLYVDRAGLLVADALDGSIRSFSLRGLPNGATPSGSFDGPSATLPAAGRLGLPDAALVVSERNANRVSVFEP